MSQEEATIFAELQTANDNLRWLASLSPDELRQYAGKFVIIAREKVVASDADISTASAAAERAGFDLNTVLIDYVPAEGESWVL